MIRLDRPDSDLAVRRSTVVSIALTALGLSLHRDELHDA